MKYAYFPGCSLESTAKEFDESTKLVAEALGIELVEIPDWNCCGATSAHNLDHELSVSLPARNLGIAERMGLDVVAPCAACYNRMRSAEVEMKGNQALRDDINSRLEKKYTGAMTVRSALEVFTTAGRAGEGRGERAQTACGPETGVLLRLPARPAAEGAWFRRPRSAGQPGQGDGGRRRGADRLVFQERVLRCELRPVEERDRGQAHRRYTIQRKEARRELHRDRVPAVHDQPRNEAGRGRQGSRRRPDDAGVLTSPSSSASRWRSPASRSASRRISST